MAAARGARCAAWSDGSWGMSSELVAAAAGLVWLGMVLGISFLEAPLKFRAPGITVPLGLGIGRIVFGALNIAESVLAVVLVAGLVVAGSWPAASIWLLAAVVLLVVQVALVRPILRRRSDRVIAGESTGGRSSTHWLYPALETLKVVALVVGAVLLLADA
jgi:hypothetical protein